MAADPIDERYDEIVRGLRALPRARARGGGRHAAAATARAAPRARSEPRGRRRGGGDQPHLGRAALRAEGLGRGRELGGPTTATAGLGAPPPGEGGLQPE